MNKQTIRDVDFSGKRVLIRVDFNVPIRRSEVQDTTRITAALPTIKHILEDNPKAVILTSHLGRPGGEPAPALSLEPVAPVLAELLGQDVAFAEDCIGEVAEEAIANLPEGGVILLENTRFHPGEKKNHADFAEKLAAHGDIFVNDAFGTAHRAHASNVGVAEHLPAVAGLLMEKEITYLNNAIEDPQRPFVAILGGAKVSDKINVIETLLGKVDKLLVGGGMANTFFAAQGIRTADSLVEEDALDKAKDLLEKGGDKLYLPVDSRIANEFDNDASMNIIRIADDGVPDGWQILDIGPETIENYKAALEGAQTIVWNGPMGVFEMPNFSHGTFAIAEALAEAADNGANSIIGGGDSASAAEKSGLADRITHISTGGGASLEMLEGNVLPGLAALADK